jgi:hypothetical protein
MGFPVDVFDYCLLCCYTFHAPYARRLAFPSWTWAGQVGYAESSISGPFTWRFKDDHSLHDEPLVGTQWVRKAVEFHQLDSVANCWNVLNAAFISPSDSGFYDQSCKRWAELDEQTTLKEARSMLLAQQVPFGRALGFWTEGADLLFDRQAENLDE